MKAKKTKGKNGTPEKFGKIEFTAENRGESGRWVEDVQEREQPNKTMDQEKGTLTHRERGGVQRIISSTGERRLERWGKKRGPD